MTTLDETILDGQTGHINDHGVLKAAYDARGATQGALATYTTTSTAAQHQAIHNTLHAEHVALGGSALPQNATSGHISHHQALAVAHNTREAATPPPTVSFPDATNTGVPAGVTLSTGWAPGDFYGSANNAVWTGYQINCTYPYEAPSGDWAKTITFRNCKFIDGGVYWMVLNENGCKLHFENCTFEGNLINTANDAALNGSDLTLTACNIYNTGDGLKVGNRVVIQDSYIHNLNVTADSHNDSLQSLGTSGDGTEGSGLLMRHNTLDATNGATCITLSTGSAGAMKDILVENNLFACNGIAVTGGYQAGTDDVTKVSNIIYRNNKLKSGSFTPAFTSTDSPVVVSGTTWYDGPNAGQAVS